MSGGNAPSSRVISEIARDPWVISGVAFNLFIALVYVTPMLSDSQMEFFTYHGTSLGWLGLVLSAICFGLVRIERADESRFWWSIALAFAFYAAGEMVVAFNVVDSSGASGGTFIDCLYFLYYFWWIFALEAEPHLDRDQVLRGRAREYSWAGRALFAAGLYTYFVLMPGWYSPENQSVWMPGFLYYSGLDLYILGRVLFRYAGSRDPRWRFVYGWLAVGTGLIAVIDILGTLRRAGWIDITTPGIGDIRWFAPFFFILLAARGKGFSFGPRDSERSVRRLAALRGAPLVVYAFAFPVIHFALFPFDTASAELGLARSLFVLVWILIYAGLSYAQHRYLVARNRKLDAARRASEAEVLQLNAELEDRVADRTAQLAAANRELQAFAYSVSHDLRTPLRSIDGFSQALAEDCLDRLGPDGQSYVRKVRGAAQRMSDLIDGLLGLSRVTRREMSLGEVDLSAMAESIAAELKQNATERKAEVVVEEGLVLESADMHLVRVAMENLLGNAWKFTADRQTTRIHVGTIEDGGEQAFFVRDNGAGFDMAHQEKLFGAFERLHRVDEFAGDGIGLATVQRIVARHGGRIWAEGEVDKGATFFFVL